MAQSVNVAGGGSWHLRKDYFQNPKSVLQTILNRQLGLPYCSSHSKVIARQLLSSRAVSEENGKPMNAAKMDLRPGKNAQHLDKMVNAPSWKQIDVSKNVDVIIAETRLCVQRNIVTSGGSVSSEEFYAVEPYPDTGLTCIKRFHSLATGMLIKAYVTANRTLSSGKNSTYLITLIEPGFLRAFDLVRNEMTDELNLPINFSQQNKIKYTELDMMDNSNKICICGMNKTLTKVIIVLSFPPWKESRIIHVEIPFEININEGVCFLQQNKCLHLTTWPLLMQKVTKTNSPLFPMNQVDCSLPNIKFEGKLTELPTILSTVKLETEQYGVMKMSVPVFYKAVNRGINFFEFQNDACPVHKFWSGMLYPGEEIDVFPFPDGTSKVLLCTHFSGRSQLVEFITEWNDGKNQKVVKATTLDVFNYWEKSRRAAQASIAAAATTGGTRPKRKCVVNKPVDVYSTKISILGITYCSLMDYIAVLTADDEEFQVVIYDPVTFNAVKALPPVLAWPGVEGSGDANKNRHCIIDAEVCFEPELIFVSFLYDADCKPDKEVFFVRLFSE